VHRDLICSQSPFFSAALNGNFEEGLKQSISLPDPKVDARHFEHVILWLYTQRLEADEFFFKDNKPTYFSLLELYSLADYLSIEAMRNTIVDRMAKLAEETNSVPTPSDTYILFERIRENAPIRKLVLDLFAFKKTDNLIHSHHDEWHPKFMRELVCKLKRPGYASLQRHEIRPWRPTNWENTRACEVCKNVLRPMISANMCHKCHKGFCIDCLMKGEGGGSLDWSISEKDCKPWIRGICAYHEHRESEACR
jgi:BTB/POZ domain-containing protein